MVILDPRIAELTDLALGEGIQLPLPIDLILWFEDMGCVVDLESGRVMRPNCKAEILDAPRAAYYSQITSSHT